MMDAGQLRGLCIDCPNSGSPLAPRTNVICASKDILLLLQSSPEATGSELGKRLLHSYVCLFSIRAADIIHLGRSYLILPKQELGRLSRHYLRRSLKDTSGPSRCWDQLNLSDLGKTNAFDLVTWGLLS